MTREQQHSPQTRRDRGGFEPSRVVARLESLVLDARLAERVNDDPDDAAREVVDLLGTRLDVILREGLGVIVDRPDLLRALDEPRRLLGLQALVFVNGSGPWDAANSPAEPLTAQQEADVRARFEEAWSTLDRSE